MTRVRCQFGEQGAVRLGSPAQRSATEGRPAKELAGSIWCGRIPESKAKTGEKHKRIQSTTQNFGAQRKQTMAPHAHRSYLMPLGKIKDLLERGEGVHASDGIFLGISQMVVGGNHYAESIIIDLIDIDLMFRSR